MEKRNQKIKLKRKNNILVKIFIILFSLFLELNGQYEKDIKKDAPPLSKEYIRLSGFESLSTWAVASLNKETYISEIFADSKDNIHFVYYDNILKLNKKALRIGLAYDYQILPNLPKNNNDEMLDIIISENKVIKAD